VTGVSAHIHKALDIVPFSVWILCVVLKEKGHIFFPFSHVLSMYQKQNSERKKDEKEKKRETSPLRKGLYRI